MLQHLPFQTFFLVAEHDGACRTRLYPAPFRAGEAVPLSGAGAEWALELAPDEATPAHHTLRAHITGGSACQAAFGLCFEDDAWTTDNFVLIPGAVYAGNRFHARQYKYSPPASGPRPGEKGPLHIGDLPRLSLEPGPSHLDQLSIDGAIPGIGIYFPARRKALVILTPQGNDIGPYGIEIIESEDRSTARLLLTSPGLRHERAFSIHGYVEPSTDRAADFAEGAQVEMHFHLHWIDCVNVQGLFDFLFVHRTDCFEHVPLRKEIPFSATWDVLHEKHNRENWRPEYDLYQVSILQDPPSPFMLFQTGWVGGMMTPFALIQEGDAESLERCLRHFAFCFKAQTEYGLFLPFFDGKRYHGETKLWVDEQGFATVPDAPSSWTLVRRIGDALYFLTRSFHLLRERGLGDRIEPAWERALEKNVAAILDMWRRHGEFGQYVDVNTGEIVIAGTTAAALIPAALVVAARYFERPEWVGAAEEIGERFRLLDLAEGVTTGGPGDCMQAPESESIAALIESFVALHEATGAAKWLKAAEDAIVQTASWVIAYDYAFPPGTALEQIGAQSRGAFLANVQNKTGVPGICTLSGQGILRAYRATGNEAYLRLLIEISHTIPQYMGRTDKKIPTRLAWGRKGLTELPPGWICERVNVTHWGEAIGEISAYSSWCEVAMMFTWCDLPGIYWDTTRKRIHLFDHVEGEILGDGCLRITNPTAFPARVKILAEDDAARRVPLAMTAGAHWPVVEVPAKSTVVWSPAKGADGRSLPACP